MPDRTIKYGLEADAREFIEGVKQAERAVEQARGRAKQLSQEETVLKSRAAELSKALQSKITNDEWVEVVKRGATNRKMLAENVAAQQKAAKDVAAAQKNLTREIERESKKQGAAQQAARNAARGAAQGAGVPLPVVAGGLVVGAAAAVAATAKKAVDDNLERAQAIRQLQNVLAGTTERVSEFLAVGEQFGLTADQMADAARNLASAIVTNPEQLHALGIATEDATGKSRPLIDVMGDVRRVMSEGKADANTFRIAQELLGRSVGDMIPWLRASEQQIDKAAAAARRAGLVMTREAVEGALRYKSGLDTLGRSIQGVVMQLGQRLIPMLGNAAEAAMRFGDLLQQVFTTRNERVSPEDFNIPFFGGLASGIGNIADAAFGRDTEALKQINATVEAHAKVREEFNKLMSVGAFDAGGDGKDFSGLDRGSLADDARAAGQAAQDAIREHIDAIREEARARQEALRDTLEGFLKERDAAIRAIQDEQDAREAAHQKRIRAIEDEQRAVEDAFTARERARSDEIDNLREQIRATQELADLEGRRQDVADADAELAMEQGVEVFRSKSMSANDYTRAVMDQNRRVKDAETKLADAKKALAKDEAKVQIEERIRAIEAASAADKRALEDYKANANDRLRTIRDQMAAEKQQADTRIQQLRDEQAAVRDRMTMIIDSIQKETDAVVKGLEQQIKALQGLASGFDAAAAAAGRAGLAARSAFTVTTGGGSSVAITNTASHAGQPVGTLSGDTQDPGNIVLGATPDDIIRAYRDLLGRDPENEGAITGRLGRNVNSVWSEIFNSPEAVARRSGIPPGTTPGDISPAMPNAPGGPQIHDFPHSMVFARPTLMVDMASGAAIGAAAVRGPETFETAGVGVTRTRGADPDAPMVLTVNVHGLGLDEAARVIAGRIERQHSRRATRGYGRKRR